MNCCAVVQVTHFSEACGGLHWEAHGHRGILIVVSGQNYQAEQTLGFNITHIHPDLDRPEEFFLRAPQGMRNVPGVKDAMINAAQVLPTPHEALTASSLRTEC